VLAYKFRSSAQIARAFDIIFERRLHCADWTTFNDPREGFFEYTIGDNQKANAIRAAKRRFRICCLSRCYSSRLLWAHYAAGFDGLAIEVSVPDPSDYGPVYTVTYEEALPHADLYPGDFDAQALSFLRRKDSEWCYESEVRIIQEDVWFQLPSPVQRVIVGHRFDKALLQALRTVCQSKHITLQRTTIEDREVIATNFPH
jgi:hypothetical protein